MVRNFSGSQTGLRVLAAALLVAAIWWAGCGSGSKAASDQNGTAQAAELQPVAVSTAKAQTQQVPVFIDATGSFVAEEASDVAPLSPGRVVETPVDVGAFVQKGEVIARLDDDDARLRLEQAKASAAQSEAALRQAEAKIGLYGAASFDATAVPEVQASRAAYESAEAEVKLAEADAQRYANLVKTGDVSQSNYEKAKTQEETAKARADAARRQYEAALNAAKQNYGGVKSAQATLDAARAQVALAEKALADTVIRAPISGYVSERPIAVGEYVGNSAKIATIVRANPIKLELQVPEARAGNLRVGMPVTASVAAYGERQFEGKVTAINPAVDPNSRALTIEAKFDNPKLDLKPGMFATAHVVLPGEEQAVMVPQAAVLSDPAMQSSQVYVIEEGKARVRVVRLGERRDGMARVLSGVSAGETVAVGNLDQLFDGVAVRAS